jgi:hypothetical protein
MRTPIVACLLSSSHLRTVPSTLESRRCCNQNHNQTTQYQRPRHYTNNNYTSPTRWKLAPYHIMLRLKVSVEPNKQHDDADAMKVAPRGLPRCRNRACGLRIESKVGSVEARCLLCVFERDVFRRKSWVIAMPIEAKEREVRSQARKVRSITYISIHPLYHHIEIVLLHSAQSHI